jgi:hypothetical protein
MAKRFEDEWTNPKSGQREHRPLKRDQVLFIAQFAHACNTVWDEALKVEEGALEVKNITCFNILLMGQGGSGKTAVVQDVVLKASRRSVSVCSIKGKIKCFGGGYAPVLLKCRFVIDQLTHPPTHASTHQPNHPAIHPPTQPNTQSPASLTVAK